MRIRDRAAASVARAVAFVADNWILLTLGAALALTLVMSGLGFDFWAERAYREGKLYETKIDPAKIFQQLGLLIIAVPALMFAIWRSWTAHQQARAATEQARIASENWKLAERGHYVDRFQTSARMLDSERLSVRLAGIYSLGELAKSDPSHHSLAMQLFAGFIRDRSAESLRLEPDENSSLQGPNGPDDIAEALRAIGTISSKAEGLPVGLNLQGADLRNQSFRGLKLMGSDFSGAQLDGSRFSGCDLTSCHFTSAAAEFFMCTLRDSRFAGVLASRFNTCDLSNANFKGSVRMPGAAGPMFLSCTVTNGNFSEFNGLSTFDFEYCKARFDLNPPIFDSPNEFKGHVGHVLSGIPDEM